MLTYYVYAPLFDESLAGIPLIAVSLRAAIASVETIARYGLMQEIFAFHRATL